MKREYFRVIYHRYFYSTEMGEWKDKLLRAVEKSKKASTCTLRSHVFGLPENISKEEITNYIAYLYDGVVTRVLNSLKNKKLPKSANMIDILKEISPMKDEIRYFADDKYSPTKGRDDVYDISNNAFVFYVQKLFRNVGLFYVAGANEEDIAKANCLTLPIANINCKKAIKNGLVDDFNAWSKNYDLNEALLTEEKLQKIRQENEVNNKNKNEIIKKDDNELIN